ncbi:Modifier of mdg4 [Operophtera brumata]|uniref:Modifier of mdg4 n=1 Tax=Operophtera brumata TaxID=104452 RepID=A0A0L7L1W0_OPEBR|nr:Modifier of mdg4 [Operophtera brumata]
MVNKYTFSPTNPGRYYCSKKAKDCKAKIFLNHDQTSVMVADNDHNHEPPVYTVTSQGHRQHIFYQPIRHEASLNVPRLHVLTDKARALLLLEKRERLQSEVTEEIKFINTSAKKKLLMVNKYTFAPMGQKHFYCSKKAKGCKARIYLTQDRSELGFT